MSTIIDLDELLGEPKRVRLANHVYVLPPDLPVELYLRIVKFAQTDASEAEMIEALYDQVLELFRYKDPKLESLPLSLKQVVGLVAKVYGDGGDEEKPAAPPRQRRSGATSNGSGQRKRTSRR